MQKADSRKSYTATLFVGYLNAMMNGCFPSKTFVPHAAWIQITFGWVF